MLHKISADSRPKLVAGSSEGYSGHVDGKPREARMNHPKGHTVDERGNIYVADTTNMAIRKISNAGNLMTKNLLICCLETPDYMLSSHDTVTTFL